MGRCCSRDSSRDASALPLGRGGRSGASPGCCDVILDGSGADRQPAGDLLVREALLDQWNDLPLALGQHLPVERLGPPRRQRGQPIKQQRRDGGAPTPRMSTALVHPSAAAIPSRYSRTSLRMKIRGRSPAPPDQLPFAVNRSRVHSPRRRLAGIAPPPTNDPSCPPMHGGGLV